MESDSNKTEIIRLKKMAESIRRKRAIFVKILEKFDQELSGLEIEYLQFLSNGSYSEKTVGENGENEDLDQENDYLHLYSQEETREEDLNKTKLDLTNNLEKILKGEFYEDEEVELDTEEELDNEGFK